MFAQITAQAFESLALAATGEDRAGVHPSAAKIPGAQFAHRPVALEGQADGVEARVAAGAIPVGAMYRQGFAQGEVAELRFVVRQLGDSGWWGRDAFAEQTADDPVAALDRAGAQTGRVFGHENRHGQEAAASVTVRVIHPHPLVRPDVEAGHAVVPGQDWADKRVIGMEEVEDGTILADEIDEETDRFLEHGLAQIVRSEENTSELQSHSF